MYYIIEIETHITLAISNYFMVAIAIAQQLNKQTNVEIKYSRA